MISAINGDILQAKVSKIIKDNFKGLDLVELKPETYEKVYENKYTISSIRTNAKQNNCLIASKMGFKFLNL